MIQKKWQHLPQLEMDTAEGKEQLLLTNVFDGFSTMPSNE